MNLSSPVHKVLLVEGNVSGHRLSYVRLLAREAISRGYSVHLATSPRASETPEFSAHLTDCLHDITVSAHSDFGIRAIEKLSLELGASRTVIPDGDASALQLARRGRWRGRSRLSLLIMRESAQPDKFRLRGLIKQLAKRAVMLRVRNIPKVDLAVLKSATWSGKSRTKVALDPVVVSCTEEDVLDIRESWKLDGTRYWFAVLGAITERKNVPLLLECLSRLAPGTCGLLIAGRIDPAVRDRIQSATEGLTVLETPVLVVDRILSDRELDAAVTATDCLLLAHSNEGPSGLLGKAACAGTRVIAAGAKSLRKDVQSLGPAAEWTQLSAQQISEAMSRATCSAAPFPQTGTNSKSFTDALLPPEAVHATGSSGPSLSTTS